MSQFYAIIKGSRGEATRGGSKRSGIEGHIRGWNIGGYIKCRHINEKDEVTMELTGGSENSNVSSGRLKIIAREKEGGYEIIKAIISGYTILPYEISQDDLDVLLLALNLKKAV